jgi:hypothetical protein
LLRLPKEYVLEATSYKGTSKAGRTFVQAEMVECENNGANTHKNYNYRLKKLVQQCFIVEDYYT